MTSCAKDNSSEDRGRAIASATTACALLALGFITAALGFVQHPTETVYVAEPSGQLRHDRFVGSAVCDGCHQAQSKAWSRSQHAHAMQEASEGTVLGDFNDAKVGHFSSGARFYRRNGQFLVETEGKDGKVTEFAIKYTFGIEPLQQYLVAFPDGRLQALPYAWDTRTKEAGGQRWFHLYPGENITHSDLLYWTGPQQNWNYMCAECHSTDVHKNYDEKKDSFDTTFSEVSVGCEACHGPAADHVKWVQNGKPRETNSGFPTVAAKRGNVAWVPDSATGSPTALAPVMIGGVNETCDRCHSRRGQFSEDWRPGQPLADTHLLSLLTSDLFEDDGQMREEVFNTSTFQQSKMFAKGVICTDCHDPHSGKLKAAGSEVCSQCHAREKFATKTHSGHLESANAPNCISCHMPARAYMVIDRRHDHSFRIPRPDLTVKMGTPNTCTSCHADRDAAWAAAAVERWHGPVRKGFQTYGQAFQAARLDLPGARDLLLKVLKDSATPSIARATALLYLRERPASVAVAEIDRGLSNSDPMVRLGALRALETLPPEVRWAHAKATLSDSVRAVRIQAASLLADLSSVTLPAKEKDALDQASTEYIEAAQLNADRSEERSNLAGFYVRQGKQSSAEEEYKAAIKLNPQSIPPRVNLADLYRMLGRDGEAEALLRSTIAELPEAAAPHYVLGLALIRQKRYGEAMQELRRALDLQPAQPRYAYVYAIALQSAGQVAEARRILAAALRANPSNTDVLMALLQDALRSNEIKVASSYVERLRMLHPDDDALAKLANQLRANPQQ